MVSAPDGEHAASFFRAMQRSFVSMLASGRGHPRLIDALTSQAFDLFEHNVAMQAEGLPEPGCHKGCWPCCTLQVTATAPEILLLAGYIRRIDDTAAGARLELPRRVAEAEAAVGGLGAAARLARKVPCPLVLQGVCIVHPVRPLACRGHASFDKHACTQVIAGGEVDVPISGPHAQVRSLVQNALQSALRDTGHAWRGYELIRALHLILSGAAGGVAWLAGADVLEPALAGDVDWIALAATFDAVGTA